MQASAFEFRIRFITHTIVFALGFWAPWNYLLHADPTGANAHLWGYLSAILSESGLINIGAAFNLLLSLGIAFAIASATLRTWGSAYLGADIVQDGSMHAASTLAGVGAVAPSNVIAAQAGCDVISDGPYRHLRNPLYLGTFLHALALALLMPRSGAIFTIFLIALLQIRLILGEEAFLSNKLGAPYAAYQALVPRLWPSPRPRTAASGRIPRWPQAFLGEVYVWGVALSFALAGWRYNAALLTQCVVVSFGISLVLRAVKPSPLPSHADVPN